MSDVRDIVSAQLEVVAPNLEDYIQSASVFGDIVESSAKAVQVSRYGYRHPVKLYMGGASSKVSWNEGTSGSGAFPVGTMMNVTHLSGAYYTQVRTYRIPDEAIDTTSSEGQSRINALSLQIADAMVGQAQEDDIGLHTDGTGVLTNSSSAPAVAGGGTASATITYAGATDYLRTAKLRVGMAVGLWSQDLTVQRTFTAPLVIIAINPATGVVTFNQTVTLNDSATSSVGDVITFAGLAAYGPSTPTSFGANYPFTSGAIPQYGVGGDSWRHGLPYANDTTTSNYFYGRLKSTRPEFLGNEVDAGGLGIDWALGRIGQAKVNARFGQAQNPQMVMGLAAEAQIAAIEDLDIAASVIQHPNGGEGQTQVKDLAAFERKVGRSIPYCGIKHYLDPRQPKNRIDYFAADCIYKIQLHPTQFVQGGDSGQYLFRCRYATTAQPISAVEFFVKSNYDFLFSFPGRHFHITNLLVSSRWL